MIRLRPSVIAQNHLSGNGPQPKPVCATQPPTLRFLVSRLGAEGIPSQLRVRQLKGVLAAQAEMDFPKTAPSPFWRLGIHIAPQLLFVGPCPAENRHLGKKQSRGGVVHVFWFVSGFQVGLSKVDFPLVSFPYTKKTTNV